MWYDYPERKDFEVSINININAGIAGVQKTITMKYKQATIFDTISFLNDISKDDISERLILFMKKHSNINKITLGLMKLDSKLVEKVFNTIKDSRFRGVFSSKQQSNTEGGGQPYGAILMSLCDKISIDPNKFQEIYTIEQMNYLIEGMIYNNNAQTVEGQEENERAVFNKTHKDEDLLQLIS